MKLFEEMDVEFLKVSLNIKSLKDEDLINLFKAVQENDYEDIRDSVNMEMKDRYNVNIEDTIEEEEE